jgi:hypothetical protein
MEFPFRLYRNKPHVKILSRGGNCGLCHPSRYPAPVIRMAYECNALLMICYHGKWSGKLLLLPDWFISLYLALAQDVLEDFSSKTLKFIFIFCHETGKDAASSFLWTL